MTNDRRQAWTALALLLGMNLLNYIDRQVLAAVEPQIEQSLFLAHDAHDPIVQTKMGLLGSAFMISYMIAAPVFGLLAGRWPRWKLLAAGAVVWSLASGASGLATGFAVLLATRALVGVGEGAYGPVAPALLSDLFPVAVRGRMMAWFYMAIPLGGALGYALGGQLAHLNPAGESWRWAFYVVVPPGLLVALWALLMREPARGGADQRPAPPRRLPAKSYLVLLRTPSLVLVTLGMTAMSFALGGLAFWMPKYLQIQKVPDVCGLTPVTFFGLLTASVGLVATLAGGWAGDRLRQRWSGSYFLVSGAGLLVCVPCTWLCLTMPFPLAWVFLGLAVFFLFFNTGPTNTIVANVTHPAMRAGAFALNILVIHALGDAISPAVVGAIADRWSLVHAMVAVSLFMALGGVAWLWGARYLQRDTEAAALRVP